MCGICGLMETTPHLGHHTLTREVRRMAETLRHRGPDGGGLWTDETQGIALAQRRLAVVDRSAAGAQPMESACRRYRIVYNGELYSAAALRGRLRDLGHPFPGHSDTRVLVEAISAWGIDGAIERVEGMFAFAVWDRERAALSLVRDRVGKKPLYYCHDLDGVLFASELKALRVATAFRGEIDRESLAFFVSHSYVPAPRSIFTGVHTVRPGEIMTLRAGSAPASRRWWAPERVFAFPTPRATEPDTDAGVEALSDLATRAVEKRLVADVPVGALLSGGIDSSLVVALMNELTDKTVHTFSIGFDDKRLDESERARAIAAFLGTRHTALIVDEQMGLDVIERLPDIYDEPFADTSQIPTFLAARLAREHVTVALSGDGGDELFGGYPRYQNAHRYWARLSGLSRCARRLGASACTRLAPSRLDRSALLLGAEDERDLFLRMNARCPRALRLVLDTPARLRLIDTVGTVPEFSNPVEWMMFVDLAGRLGNSMLTKVDRASMAVGLEVRCPLLDRDLVDWALRAPLSWKIRGGESKWLLRRVLDTRIPRRLVTGPKRGFGIPIDVWLRGPMRDWAEALLDHHRLREEGYLDADAVRRVWRVFLRGSRKHRFLVWNLLMFQHWLAHDTAFRRVRSAAPTRNTEPWRAQEADSCAGG